MKDEKSHAESNAEGHAESILELYRAFVGLDGGADIVNVDGQDYTRPEEIIERAEENALAVNVRSDWFTPGDTDGSKPSEFLILLSTGGPALRIVGDLDTNGRPDGDFSLQHQDWGTPWTDYQPDVADEDDWTNALDWFVGCFYFGE